jgi:ABC-type sugar transport system ATPase subunit
MNRPIRGDPARWQAAGAQTTPAIEEGIAYVSEDRLNLGLVLEQDRRIFSSRCSTLPNRRGWR